MCCSSGNVVLIQQYERTGEYRAVPHQVYEEKLYCCKVCGDIAHYPFICCGEKMKRVKRPAEVLRPA